MSKSGISVILFFERLMLCRNASVMVEISVI